MNILPQIALIAQRNAASCIISQRKTVWVGVVFVVFVVLSFCGSSALSARSAGDIGFSLWWQIEYSYVNILSQIAQIAQRECSRLHHFAEKDSL